MIENPRKRPAIKLITSEIKRLRVTKASKNEAFSDENSWSDEESLDFTSKPQNPDYADKMSVS